MANPNAVGQPTKLTPARLDTIVKLLRSGNYVAVAAEGAGVSESAVYKWLERGERPEEQEADSIYFQFVQAVRTALAEAEQVLVASIEKAATGYTKKTKRVRTYTDPESGRECVEETIEEAEVFDWRAASWMLQARHKQRWAANPPPAAEAEQEHVKVLVIGEAPPVDAPGQLEQGEPATFGDALGV